MDVATLGAAIKIIQQQGSGTPGRGISKLEITTDGQLIVTYTDATTQNLGKITGEDGAPGQDGANGKDGVNGIDGYSPTAKVEQTENGVVITITDKNGTTAATVTNGADGIDGTDGANGQDGKTPYIKDNNWWIGDVDTGIKAIGQDGQNGIDGEDGYAPRATVTQNDDGATIVIIDVNGTTTAKLYNGADGADGATGANGKSAYEIAMDHGEARTEEEWLASLKGEKGADGDTITQIYVVEGGDNGFGVIEDSTLNIVVSSPSTNIDTVYQLPMPQGEKGEDGYTPVKGVDYFTTEEKQEMVTEIRNDLGAVYTYKGSVEFYADLSEKEATAQIGDVWNVINATSTATGTDTSEGMNYAWTGETWDALGSIFAIKAFDLDEDDMVSVPSCSAVAQYVSDAIEAYDTEVMLLLGDDTE